MKKFNELKRLKIYRIMRKIIIKVPTANSWPTDAQDLDKDFKVNFCRVLGLISLNHTRELVVHDVTELLEYRPNDDDCWAGSKAYWFHPYDKKPRLEILDSVISKMESNLKWYDYLLLPFIKIK